MYEGVLSKMKRLVFAVALIVVGPFHQVAYAEADSPVECFSSPEAVHDAHPGSHAVYTTHATWWTESPKCWFVGEPAATRKTKPRIAAADAASVRSRQTAQAVHPQVKQEAKARHEEKAAVHRVYEENATALRALLLDYAPALRALLLGPDESQTDFEGRFSVIYYKAPR
jgi:hypothetical protein